MGLRCLARTAGGSSLDRQIAVCRHKAWTLDRRQAVGQWQGRGGRCRLSGGSDWALLVRPNEIAAASELLKLIGARCRPSAGGVPAAGGAIRPSSASTPAHIIRVTGGAPPARRQQAAGRGSPVRHQPGAAARYGPPPGNAIRLRGHGSPRDVGPELCALHHAGFNPLDEL